VRQLLLLLCQSVLSLLRALLPPITRRAPFVFCVTPLLVALCVYVHRTLLQLVYLALVQPLLLSQRTLMLPMLLTLMRLLLLSQLTQLAPMRLLLTMIVAS
jgi:hypothetical protein